MSPAAAMVNVPLLVMDIALRGNPFPTRPLNCTSPVVAPAVETVAVHGVAPSLSSVLLKNTPPPVSVNAVLATISTGLLKVRVLPLAFTIAGTMIFVPVTVSVDKGVVFPTFPEKRTFPTALRVKLSAPDAVPSTVP